MFTRSIFIASLLSFSVATSVFAGCAAPPADEGASFAETSNDLDALAKAIGGQYHSSKTQPGNFARLTLGPNGGFTASIDVSDVALCQTLPCLAPQSGVWSASKDAAKNGGEFRLRLKADGDASARIFTAKLTNEGLTLARAGETQTLLSLPDGACDVDPTGACGSNEDPSNNDPSNEDPSDSTCKGAWLDQDGLCRDLADGVLPASCCADLTPDQ